MAVLGETLSMKITRGAESWQFFAFVFAALTLLEFEWLSAIPNVWASLAAKTVAFVVTFYVVMLNPGVRNWQVKMLGKLKELETR